MGDIPEWVYFLVTTAEFLEPYLIQLNKFIVHRRGAAARAARENKKGQSPANQSDKCITTDPQVQEVVLHDLHHAMAARTQKSFRLTRRL